MSLGVGIIGAGNISTQYLTNLATYPDVHVVAIGDLDEPRAAAQAAKHAVPSSGSADSIIANGDVDLVVNLTIPAAHVEVSRRALAAGKHVWTEKPLGLTRQSARELLLTAEDAGLRLGCAPDTVFGPSVQASLRTFASDEVGPPVGAFTAVRSPGPDAWHPNPEFFFQRGGGPVLDIGPYYLTTLVLALGPVVEVVAGGGRARDVREVKAGERAGTRFGVEVPTTVNALLTHESGVTSVAMFSFDAHVRRIELELSGVTGAVAAADPNYFAGEVTLFAGGSPQRTTAVEARGMGRGIGVVDMARSIAAGVPHRANGELAYHVLDIMLAAEESVESARPVELTSRPPVTKLMPDDWSPLEKVIG